MATVTLNKPFDMLEPQDWGWTMDYKPTKITLDDGVHRQTLTGTFTTNGTDIFGTVNSSQYFVNNVLTFSVTGMDYDAHEMQIHAETYGDTQDTYADVLFGNDTLNGSSGNDRILGYGGSDIINGRGGRDILDGDAGADKFRFNTTLNASTNVDTITDFSASDFLQLENAIFTKLTHTGVLNAANFRASTSGNAVDTNDYILYETDTGKVFYDSDGSGAGAKIQFGLIGTGSHFALSAADISVI